MVVESWVANRSQEEDASNSCTKAQRVYHMLPERCPRGSFAIRQPELNVSQLTAPLYHMPVHKRRQSLRFHEDVFKHILILDPLTPLTYREAASVSATVCPLHSLDLQTRLHCLAPNFHPPSNPPAI